MNKEKYRSDILRALSTNPCARAYKRCRYCFKETMDDIYDIDGYSYCHHSTCLQCFLQAYTFTKH
jgi:hypothetical protein